MILAAALMLEMLFILQGGDSVSVQTTEIFCDEVKEQHDAFIGQGKKFVVVLTDRGQVLDDVIMIFCRPENAKE